MKPWHLRLFAFVVFAVSFALPAVRLEESQPQKPPGSSDVPGYLCAFVANYAAPAGAMKSPDGVTMDAVLVSASGGVNLLVLAVLFLSIWSRLARSCLILVGLVLPCLAATWIYFTKEHLAALIGHDLWVAGALLFAAPEILSIQRRRASARAETLATPAGT